MLRVVLTFSGPLQLSGLGDLASGSFANESSSGENLRVAHEPVGDRYGYRVEIALLPPSAKGHHVRFVWHHPLMIWKKRVESCWLRER